MEQLKIYNYRYALPNSQRKKQSERGEREKKRERNRERGRMKERKRRSREVGEKERDKHKCCEIV